MPTKNGKHVSAKSPGVLNESGVGFSLRCRYGKKLAGEAKLGRLDDLEPTDAVLGAIVAAGG